MKKPGQVAFTKLALNSSQGSGAHRLSIYISQHWSELSESEIYDIYILFKNGSISEAKFLAQKKEVKNKNHWQD